MADELTSGLFSATKLRFPPSVAGAGTVWKVARQNSLVQRGPGAEPQYWGSGDLRGDQEVLGLT